MHAMYHSILGVPRPRVRHDRTIHMLLVDNYAAVRVLLRCVSLHGNTQMLITWICHQRTCGSPSYRTTRNISSLLVWYNQFLVGVV